MVREDSRVTSTHAADTAAAKATGLARAGLSRWDARMKGERRRGMARMARAPYRVPGAPGPKRFGL